MPNRTICPAVFIPKEECIAHVTKIMGTGLRKLIKDYKDNFIVITILGERGLS